MCEASPRLRDVRAALRLTGGLLIPVSPAALGHRAMCQRVAVIALDKTTVGRPLAIAFFETIHILPPSILPELPCRIRRTRKSER